MARGVQNTGPEAKLDNAKVTKTTKTAKAEKPSKVVEKPDDFEQFPSSDDNEEDDEEEEEFDGFESTDDEADDVNETAAKHKGKVDEVKIKQAIKEKGSKKEKPGVVYVGRVPHGFYEDQMKAYFSQFGTISKLRLSRNKQTGKSKHYAFIEFEDHEVAQIVAESMDNYLLFGHILKVKTIDPENVHEDMFVGSNKRFKAMRWDLVARRRHEAPKSLEKWQELEAKRDLALKNKNDKLAALGINYSYSDSKGTNSPKVAKAKVSKAKAKTTKKTKA